MKSTIILVITLFLSMVSVAQSFKDLYETIPQNDRFSNMMNIRNYQELNPDHAISYYLLGEIYDAYMREADPLKNFDVLSSDYNQLLAYYSLVKYKLDEKQARQDRDYYGEVKLITDKKKAGLPDILNELEGRLESSKSYYNNAKILNENYFRCINKYNECLYSFRRILSVYPNYKDLYLLATPTLLAEIEQMSLNFDSALVFFEEYKSSSKSMTHLLKINDYRLNPIITYRLEGLIEADFTLPLIQLWDYKSWASNFLNLMDSEIGNIRKGIVFSNKRIDEQIVKLLKEEVYSDEFDVFKVDVKLQNLIGKYDHASLVNELLAYKTAKLKFTVNTRSEMNNILDEAPFYLINKLRFYRELFEEKEALNQKVNALKNSTSMDDVAKYIDFFGQYYNGMDGFIRWCEVEKYKNDEIFNSNLSNLELFISRDAHANDFVDSVFIFNNNKMAFGVQPVQLDSVNKDSLLTTAVVPLVNRTVFQQGIHVDKDKTVRPFISKISSKGKVEWLKYPSLINENKLVLAQMNQMQISYDSICYTISSSDIQRSDSLLVSKIFIDRYNWNGQNLKQFSYVTYLKPIHFWVDEINERYLIIEKDFPANDSVLALNTMAVKMFSLKDELLWEKQFMLEGSLIDVIQTNSNFLIHCNYTTFSFDEIALKNKSDIQSMVSIYMTNDGKVKHINDYRTEGNLDVQNCFKLSNNAITILGEISSESSTKNKNFYLLVNENGVPENCNLKNLKHQLIEQ